MNSMEQLSFGAELELADIDQRKGLPDSFAWDRSDPSMVNSNGIAIDPKGISYSFGGEVQTKPTIGIQKQIQGFQKIIEWFGNATVNYRSNLHIHVQVKGLSDNLRLLKRFQKIIHTEVKEEICNIEHIPEPLKKEYATTERYKRTKIDY